MVARRFIHWMQNIHVVDLCLYKGIDRKEKEKSLNKRKSQLFSREFLRNYVHLKVIQYKLRRRITALRKSLKGNISHLWKYHPWIQITIIIAV